MQPSQPPKPIETERLSERVEALPGIAALREAASGASAYLVGGAVRDLLVGRERADVDVAVEGDPAELARRLGGEARSHERFGTLTVRVDGLEIDLATARSETYPRPGALPEVRPASLVEDLARRDFTINAMAVPLTGQARLVDPHGGLADLERGVLRTLHPGSMVDDPTRALRGARYAARYGIRPDPATADQIRAADLSTVSADRVEAELRKLAREPEPRRGFELAGEWGLVALAPGAEELIDTVAKLVAAEPWRGVAPGPDAVLAAALGECDGAAPELAAADPAAPSEAVALALGRRPECLIVARAMGAAWLDRYLEEWRDVRLEIDGDDLLEAGVPEGPAIGAGLAAALRAKLDGEIAGREAELRVALAAATGREGA